MACSLGGCLDCVLVFAWGWHMLVASLCLHVAEPPSHFKTHVLYVGSEKRYMSICWGVAYRKCELNVIFGDDCQLVACCANRKTLCAFKCKKNNEEEQERRTTRKKKKEQEENTYIRQQMFFLVLLVLIIYLFSMDFCFFFGFFSKQVLPRTPIRKLLDSWI